MSGSLQARSTNTAVLEIAAARAPAGVDVVLFDGLARIAPFNPDVEPAPPPVEAFRAVVRSADGIMFATPEYAHGVPGALKNALDWLVGTGEIYGKPAVVLSAAPSADRAEHARADLERTLRAQGARVLASFTIAVPAAARGREMEDAGIAAAVDRALRAFT